MRNYTSKAATLLAVLALAAGILGGSSADATTNQTIQYGVPIYVSYGTCAGWVSIANFGHALAQFEQQAGAECHPNTYVQVISFYNGQIKDNWTPCQLWYRLSNPYPTACQIDGAKITSIGGGSVVGANLWICYGSLYSFACSERHYSIWG